MSLLNVGDMCTIDEMGEMSSPNYGVVFFISCIPTMLLHATQVKKRKHGKSVLNELRNVKISVIVILSSFNANFVK